MIERSYIHVGGPPGSGKTALIEAILARGDHLILVARCVRDDSLPAARESYPKSHPELRRYRQAGGIGRALFEFPRAGADPDAFFTTGLMEGYSEAVIVEGDSPLDFLDLDSFVAPPLGPDEELFVRGAVDVAAADRARAAALESLLRQSDGGARWIEEEVGFTVGSFLAKDPQQTSREVLTMLLGGLKAARKTRPKLVYRWAINERYQGIERAGLVVVNIRDEGERKAAERLVAEVTRLRKEEVLFKDILSQRGHRLPITAVVANISDPKDAGLKKALTRVRRSMRARSM